ncbi:MAG: hypothetical protein V4534_05420 [Myxococcota bacterium]
MNKFNLVVLCVLFSVSSLAGFKAPSLFNTISLGIGSLLSRNGGGQPPKKPVNPRFTDEAARAGKKKSVRKLSGQNAVQLLQTMQTNLASLQAATSLEVAQPFYDHLVDAYEEYVEMIARSGLRSGNGLTQAQEFMLAADAAYSGVMRDVDFSPQNRATARNAERILATFRDSADFAQPNFFAEDDVAPARPSLGSRVVVAVHEAIHDVRIQMADLTDQVRGLSRRQASAAQGPAPAGHPDNVFDEAPAPIVDGDEALLSSDDDNDDADANPGDNQEL